MAHTVRVHVCDRVHELARERAHVLDRQAALSCDQSLE